MAKRPSPSAMRKVLDTLAELETPEAFHPKPDPPPERKVTPWGGAQALLNKLGIDRVCALILEGASVRDIATEVGVSHGSVLNWLEAPGHSARVREAREKTAWHWDDEAVKAIRDAAADPVEMVRARELAFHYRWRAGKLNQAIYGDKTKHEVVGEVVHLTTEQVEARIAKLEAKRRSREPLTIEHETE